jgi:hypothetical protein
VTRSRLILAGALFFLLLASIDTWLRIRERGESVARADTARAFGRYEISGVEPWCTVPVMRLAAADRSTIPATCAWLSQQHCERSNIEGVASLGQVCVLNPLAPP